MLCVLVLNLVLVNSKPPDTPSTAATPTTPPKRCAILISELLGSLGNQDKDAFIELEGICNSGSPEGFALAGYKLVFLHLRLGKLFMQGTISFQAQKLNANGFITIGGANVKEKSLLFSSPESRFVSQTNTGLFSEKLPYAVALLFPVDGLKKVSRLTELAMGGRGTGAWTEVPITSKLEAIINENLVDLVVYRGNSIIDKCPVYDRICSAFEQKQKYVLRDFTFIRPPPTAPAGQSSTVTQKTAVTNRVQDFLRCTTPNQDVSIPSTNQRASKGNPTPTAQFPPNLNLINKMSVNRCCSTAEAFVPETFKLAKPSPNAINNCQCGVPLMIIDLALPDQLLSTETEANIVEQNIAEERSYCSTDPTTNKVTNLRDIATTYAMENLIDNYASSSSTTTAEPGRTMPDNMIDPALEEAYSRIVNNQADTASQAQKAAASAKNKAEADSRENKWKEMIKDMKKYQTHTLPIPWFEDKKTTLITWMDYTSNSQEPKKSVLRCSVCHEGGKKSTSLNAKNKPTLADEKGMNLDKSVHDIQKMIRNHPNSEWHTTLTQEKEEANACQVEKGLSTQFIKSLESLRDDQKQTARMLLTMYTEDLMYVPFKGHEKLMQLFKILGVEMGYHHSDRTAATRMLHHISIDMHHQLLKYITKKERALSIMLDTATDSQANDFITVLFQFTEADVPVTYFYKISTMGADFTAEAFLRKLREMFQEDKTKYNIDLWEYLKRNLVGFTTDGAATFTGPENGLGVMLSEALFNDKARLFRIHCLPHRLSLAGKHAVEDVPELIEYERLQKAMTVFYNGQNAKNFAHLKATADAFQLKLYRLCYTFDTRWAGNGALCSKRDLLSLPLVLMGLTSLHGTASFAEETKQKALGLLNSLGEPSNVMLSHWIGDMFDILKFFSDRLQLDSDTIIGKGGLGERMIKALEEMRTDSKKQWFAGLMDKLTCMQTAISTSWTKCRNAKQVEEAFQVRWKYHPDKEPILLKKQTSRTSTKRTFEQVTGSIIDSLITQVKKYFPEASYINFDILHPKNFKLEDMSTLTYGITEIGNLADRFLWRIQSKKRAVDQWKTLAFALTEFPGLDAKTKLGPRKFWSFVLRESGIQIGSDLREIITIALTISPSSAGAERSFSNLKHIKSPRRNRLLVTTLDDLLRVVLNGPKDLRLFPAARLAKSWKGMATGDKRSGGGGKKRTKGPLTEPETCPRKRIFTTEAETLAQEDANQASVETEEQRADRFENELDAEIEDNPAYIYFLSDEGWEGDQENEDDIRGLYYATQVE